MAGQLAIREKLLDKNKELLLKKKFEDFNTLAMEACRLNGTASRKRKSKTWDKRSSVAWKNGRKAYAEGSVYKFPEQNLTARTHFLYLTDKGIKLE
ncbi:hypothetical protein [Okeania sp. SIO2B3]|uniref:hypothetical protein n=1 Tax=Okeania sp. SIO2B3 TaxID=2607784 RepID=UPI0013BFC6CC|nr:hypothetical protein [Okeania sp. SIO2B3]NET46530.1 hypothetical protein [Okeania sp. SIO2B3]